MDEHNQGLHYFSFMVTLDEHNRICNTLDDFSRRICVLNKTEDG